MPCVRDVLNLLSQVGKSPETWSWPKPNTLSLKFDARYLGVGSKPYAPSRAQQVELVIPCPLTACKG